MQLATKFFTLFKGNMGAHGIYNINSKEGDKLVGKAATVREEVTEELWEKHLDGVQGLGIVPINEESTCIFGAIDLDFYPIDYEKVAQEIKRYKLPLIPCKSKSGGLHLYLFISAPVPAKLLQDKLLEFAITLGYGTSEIFPKQVQLLVDRGDIGGWINMPYFDVKSTTRYGVYPDGSTMSVEEFLLEVNDNLQTPKSLAHLSIVSDIVPEGPPCLHHLLNKKVTQGGRNIVMSNLVVYLKKVYPEDVLNKALAYNTKYFEPPLIATEVIGIVRSKQKKEYEYACKISPLKDNCNKSLCHTKKHGVTSLSASSFQLDNLTKYDSDPPIWFATIQGLGIRLELSTEDLQNQLKFQARCLNAANILPPKVNGNAWMNMIQELLKTLTIIPAPSDTSIKGQFLEHLEKFCTGRSQAKQKDELILGKPWSIEDLHYIRLSDLMSYLDRNHFKELKINQVSSLLKDLGGISEADTLKGKVINYWKVPGFKRQTESFAIQGLEKEEVM